MYYRKPLIISDNLTLCRKFLEISERLDLNFFTYSVSPYSNSDSFREYFSDIKIYNLKDEKHVSEIISDYDIVFSIHCKQFFPSSLINNVKCINIHPGYNPINRGWYPQVFSIIHDLPIGATIHEIDKELDHGPIIARELVEKFEFDTSESLYNRILMKEVELIEKYLLKILNNDYEVFVDYDKSNLFLKKDFKNLL